MMKVFISQPMRGKTDEEIVAERNRIISLVNDKAYGEQVEILDTFFDDYNGSPIEFLACSLKYLSSADLAVFAPGWKLARGCRIEHLVCDEYGIKTLDIDSETKDSDKDYFGFD